MPAERLDTCFERGENNFDFLRMFFAVLVILSHSYSTVDGKYDREPLSVFTHAAVTLGSLSVGGFFIISGALITRSMLKGRSVFNFTKKRAARILPGYIAACAISVLAFALVTRNGHETLVLGRQMALFDRPISPAVWPNNPYAFHLNGSLWTIKYELMCYVMVAVLGVLLLLRWWFALPLFLIVTSVLAIEARLHLMPARFWSFAGAVPLFAFFLAGMVAYLCRKWIPMSAALFILCIVLLALLWRFAPQPDVLSVQPILFAYIVFYIAFDRRLPLAHFGRPGDFSYGTYLWAFPIQQIIVWKFGRLSPFAVFIFALPATLIIAVLSWRLVEKPFLHHRSRATAPETR